MEPEKNFEFPSNFIKQIIQKDLENHVVPGVVTRFPPEPNGYLHIGHAKAICINFGLAQEFQGRCHLRFDDTNPEAEDGRYVEAIQEDIRWLGYDWGKHLYYASDYFEQIYQWAQELIRQGKAYVCSLSEEQLREYRGNFTVPGKNSPYRNRPVEENLDLFQRMKKGEFPEGVHVLRAKIDMASPNINLRDPLLYRILRTPHHRIGSQWCIYPLYDFAHPLSDAIEGISHSLCSLEFQDHRPFYDWCIENCPVPAQPRQYEFARLKMNYLVMSKRKLIELVRTNRVEGWDDARMPTLSGLRRRGYTPESIKLFIERSGVSKSESIIDYELLENCVRQDLENKALRTMAVLNPLKVTIKNWNPSQKELFQSPLLPKRSEMGERSFYFTQTLYIEHSDFQEFNDPNFFRLTPQQKVRLRNAYVIQCEEVIKDSCGKPKELLCSYFPETKSGKPMADGKKVKGIIHWVSATECIEAEVRIYDRLFLSAQPECLTEEEVQAGKDFKSHLNPKSLEIIPNAKFEKNMLQATFDQKYQFERIGYFCRTPSMQDSKKIIFNKIVDLKAAQMLT